MAGTAPGLFKASNVPEGSVGGTRKTAAKMNNWGLNPNEQAYLNRSSSCARCRANRIHALSPLIFPRRLWGLLISWLNQRGKLSLETLRRSPHLSHSQRGRAGKGTESVGHHLNSHHHHSAAGPPTILHIYNWVEQVTRPVQPRPVFCL